MPMQLGKLLSTNLQTIHNREKKIEEEPLCLYHERNIQIVIPLCGFSLAQHQPGTLTQWV